VNNSSFKPRRYSAYLSTAGVGEGLGYRSLLRLFGHSQRPELRVGSPCRLTNRDFFVAHIFCTGWVENKIPGQQYLPVLCGTGEVRANRCHYQEFSTRQESHTSHDPLNYFTNVYSKANPQTAQKREKSHCKKAQPYRLSD